MFTRFLGDKTAGEAPHADSAMTSKRKRTGAGSPERSMQLALHSVARAGTANLLEHSRRALKHPVATAAGHPSARFRLPTFADLKKVFTDKKLAIPESVIKDRVAELLGRMQRDKRLKTKDSVPTIISKIFPAPGVIDETEFKKAVDDKDLDKIYMNVLDADAIVKASDKPGLKTAMTDSIALMKKVEGDAAGLKAVFGTKDAAAKTIYGKAQKALDAVSKDLDKHVTTDYNLDDPQTGLGGFANFAVQLMHLELDVVKGTDPKETKTTLIHESSHLADSSVDDLGYYATPNFEALPDATKVANAAHYEELPRRELGTSKFPALTFTPGKLKSGAAPKWEDNIRRAASEALRQAWDASVDAHGFIRKVRKDILAGSTTSFTTNKVLIFEMSKLMDLTIHTQDPANAQVTDLDVALTESIAHGVSIIGDIVETIPVVAPPGPFPSAAAKDKATTEAVIAASIAKYGKLLNDPARDKKLVDWLTAHIGTFP